MTMRHADPMKISRPSNPQSKDVQTVETTAAKIRKSFGAVVLTAGRSATLTQIGAWESGNPEQSRTVRVTVAPVRNNDYAQFLAFTQPIAGALLVVKEFGQSGTPYTHIVACPCDFSVCASRVEIYGIGCGLPYQASFQNTPPITSNVNVTVNASITEQESFLWPSVVLYPSQTVVSGAGPSLPASGVAPLFEVPAFGPVVENGCAGFLRSFKVTNTTATGVLVNLFDGPATAAAPTGPNAYPYVQTVPFYAPGGSTVIEPFDDLPFFWGPWVGVSATPGGAWASGTGILVEATYVPLQPQGF